MKFCRYVAWFSAASCALVGIFSADSARAQQLDTNPPVPNVLLLIDNSGSMERMIDGNVPEQDTPSNACNCDAVAGTCNWSSPPQPNRWNLLQEALTGTPTNGFNCVAMPRTPNSVFASEYQIAHQLPYDTNYYLNFHRMVAQDNSTGTSVPCVVAPGVLPGVSTGSGVGPNESGGDTWATDWSGAIIDRPYNTQSTTTTSTCQFAQLPNGMIGNMTDLMRFGLMTFDQDSSPLTGVSGTGTSLVPATSQAPDPSGFSGAFAGMWSYFPGWNSGTTITCPASPTASSLPNCVSPVVSCGDPVNCATSTTMAVGARNPAAPPWEGRMVQFPSASDIGTQHTNNGNVGQVVLASRPYGATPMAGMFTGAQYYLTTDPNGPQKSDPYVQGGCRPEFIIVVTDGAPNQDLRPDCASGGCGNCPFQFPETIAGSLYNSGQASGSQQFVTTYVIGFAVSSFQDEGPQAVSPGSLINCSSLVTNGTLSATCGSSATGPPDPLYAPCCELERIANAGGSQHAYFADTPTDLQSALGTILASIATHATTRTVPTYSQTLGNNTYNSNGLQTASEAFFASFNPGPTTTTVSSSINGLTGVPWSGDIQRQRTDCNVSAQPTPQAITVSAGDDFATDLNTGPATGRTLVLEQPSLLNGKTTRDSTATIRPYATATTVIDGLTLNSVVANGTQYAASNPTQSVIQSLANTPDALGIAPSPGLGCPYTPMPGTSSAGCTGGTCYLAPSSCATMLLDFADGQSFSAPSNFAWAPRTANAFGDIFHATPAAVGPPASLIQDPSYVAFKAYWSGTSGLSNAPTTPRDQIVYAATNDGLLHAFWADVPNKVDNERWGFIPPAVMPNLLSSYPSSHQFLLDGSPIIKDVVWQRSSVSTQEPGSDWHTMLVAGFGPYEQGYYALDVSNPNPANLTASGGAISNDANGYPPGPVFRWQLTKMPSTNFQIFADHSATPTITTLFFDPTGGSNPKEIGVALLPGGGTGDAPTGGVSCARASTSLLNSSAPATAFTARTAVRCWGPTHTNTDAVPGRSLAVVRIDDGEIVRVFGRLADFVSGDTLRANSLVNDTPLDSPMTGTPIVYPIDVGTTATKAFVGDADGTIWRFDLSSSNPANWTGGLYLDLYNTTVDVPASTGSTWNDGQPVEVPPVESIDTSGNLVLNIASGTIEKFDTTGLEYVYSITETPQTVSAVISPRANVNWWFGPQSTPDGFQAGERVSGPMAVFDGTLYFTSYYAGNVSASCNPGSAYLRGFDFEKPAACASAGICGNGGVVNPNITANGHNYITGAGLGASPGAVIPGTSILASPPCSSGLSTSSSYYGGSHSVASTFTAQTFSLFMQVGASGSGTAAQQLQLPLPVLTAPAAIDSWAAVLE